MHAEIAKRRPELMALCRRHGVARLEVFGSAARHDDFDPMSSDADFLVTFTPATRNDLAAFADFKDALETVAAFWPRPRLSMAEAETRRTCSTCFWPPATPAPS